MTNVVFDKSRVVKYLAWTFALSYATQVVAAIIYNSGNTTVGRLVVAAGTDQAVRIGAQPFHTDGPARVELAGGDAHLCAEAVTEAVGEAGGAVDINACAVHAGQEFLPGDRALRDDRVGMMGAVAVDMRNGFLNG